MCAKETVFHLGHQILSPACDFVTRCFEKLLRGGRGQTHVMCLSTYENTETPAYCDILTEFISSCSLFSCIQPLLSCSMQIQLHPQKHIQTLSAAGENRSTLQECTPAFFGLLLHPAGHEALLCVPVHSSDVISPLVCGSQMLCICLSSAYCFRNNSGVHGSCACSRTQFPGLVCVPDSGRLCFVYLKSF